MWAERDAARAARSVRRCPAPASQAPHSFCFCCQKEPPLPGRSEAQAAGVGGDVGQGLVQGRALQRGTSTHLSGGRALGCGKWWPRPWHQGPRD